jgi:hypothetical protein
MDRSDEPKPELMFPNTRLNSLPPARKEWDRLSGELGALRMLTNLASLAASCTAYAPWAEANEAIQKYGVMIKSPQRSYSVSVLFRRQSSDRDHHPAAVSQRPPDCTSV